MLVSLVGSEVVVAELEGEVGIEPYFPAVARQICLILLAIQAMPVLSRPIIFKPFGVRFGVRSSKQICTGRVTVE